MRPNARSLALDACRALVAIEGRKRRKADPCAHCGMPLCSDGCPVSMARFALARANAELLRKART